jgi:micrococcal nuclease
VSAWAESISYRALVVRVVDGDTVWLQPAGGGGIRKLRVQGIDAPEICQADGRAARDTLRSLLQRQWVDVRSLKRDTYDRDLGHLWWQGQDVGEWMVREGWAWSYRWQGESGPYADVERQANVAQRGVHRRSQAVYPGTFRRLHGPCRPK